MENWREFLNEKMMLKPGENGWDLYRQLVGQAYMDAPEEQPGASASYEAVGEWVNKWREKGVHRSHTFAEFQEQSVPGFLQEAFFMMQHQALRNRRNASDNSLMAPGKKAS